MHDSGASQGPEFAALLASRAGKLREYLRAHIPPSLRPVANEDDLLQEVYAAAYRAGPTFVPRADESFDAWLLRIARNELIDFLRASQAAKRGGHERILELAADLMSPARTPSSIEATRERISAVHQAMEKLSPEDRKALSIVIMEGLPREEAALMMQMSEHAVNSLVWRAKKRLQALMGRRGRYFTDGDI